MNTLISVTFILSIGLLVIKFLFSTIFKTPVSVEKVVKRSYSFDGETFYTQEEYNEINRRKRV